MTEPQDDLPPGPYSINPMGGDCFQIIGAANDMPIAVVAGEPLARSIAAIPEMRAELAEMLQHKDGGDRYEEYIRIRAENEINRLAAQAAANIAREIDAENKRLRMEKAELIEMLATRTTHPEYVELLRRYKPEDETEA